MEIYTISPVLVVTLIVELEGVVDAADVAVVMVVVILVVVVASTSMVASSPTFCRICPSSRSISLGIIHK